MILVRHAQAKLSIFLLIFTLLISCDSDEADKTKPRATGENRLRENSFLVDTLTIIEIDQEKLSLQKVSATEYQVGSVIVVPQKSRTSFPIFRKITKVEDKGEAIEFTTTDASLNETFSELHIHEVYQETFQIEEDAEGRISDNSEDIETSMTINLPDLTWGEGGTKMSGKMQVNLKELVFDYDLNPDSDMPEWILLRATMNTEGSGLTFSNNAGQLTLLKKLHKKYPLKTFYVPIPIGTLVVRVPLKHSFTLFYRELTVDGKIEVNLQPRYTIVYGKEYKAATGWKDLSSVVAENSVKDLDALFHIPNMTASASLTIVEPFYEIGPPLTQTSLSVSMPIKMTATIQPEKPNWKVAFSTGIAGSVNVGWLTGEKTKLLSVEFEKELLGKEGNFVFAPSRIDKVGTYPLTIDVNKAQKISVKVTHKSGQFLSDKDVKWSITKGNGTLSAAVTTTELLSSGVAEVMFTPTEAGEVTVTAVVDPLFQDEPVENSPLTFSFKAEENLPDNYIRMTSTLQTFSFSDGGSCTFQLDDPADNPSDYFYDTNPSSNTQYIVAFFSDYGAQPPEGTYSCDLKTAISLSFAHPDFPGFNGEGEGDLTLVGSFTLTRDVASGTTIIQFSGTAMECIKDIEAGEDICTNKGEVTGRMILPCQ